MEVLKIIETIELKEQVKKQVFELWNAEYPQKLSYDSLAEFDAYLLKLSNPTNYLLINDNRLILGWAFTFDRENEKWFAIILSQIIQGRGFGKKLLDELKQTAPILNGWVIDHNNDKKQNGELYISPLKFYEKCGFEILMQDRLELDKISAVKIRWTNNK